MKYSKIPVARFSLIFNLSYALGNAVLGFATRSWWFVTLCLYYAVLGVMRFCVLRMQEATVRDTRRRAGFGFLALSICLFGVLILCAVRDRGVRHHPIIMIAIALYTFIKLGIALCSLIRSSRFPSHTAQLLRRISFADTLVSIASLQRSMLVSFDGMGEATIRAFNLCTGGAVCLCVCLMGLCLIGGRSIDRVTSRLVQMQQKIAEGVTDGYKKIEEGVTEGYKKIEESVVKGYARIEDAFVARCLTREGESVENAKKRLKKEKDE